MLLKNHTRGEIMDRYLVLIEVFKAREKNKLLNCILEDEEKKRLSENH